MISAIIQARTGSSRFPRKIYHEIDGKTVLEYVCHRVSRSKVLQGITLAMPEYDRDELHDKFGILANDIWQKIAKTKESLKVSRLFFGNEDNVLSRYYYASKNCKCDLLVRITADCPLIMPELIDEMLIHYMKNGFNGYMYNRMSPEDQYPGGFDVEIFPYWVLCETFIKATGPEHLEHVTSWMRENIISYSYENRAPHIILPHADKKFSLDTPEELPMIERAIAAINSGLSVAESLEKAVIG
jgi:spore coat polysaccharide biosynthesis protein SpsF